VFNLNYDFHAGNHDNGNVFGITNNKDTTRSQTFTYDALNRLTSAQNAGTDCNVMVLQNKTKFWGNSYSYDAWGNLVNQGTLLAKTVTKCGAENLSVTADAQNRIHATSGADYRYDAAGNLTFNATPHNGERVARKDFPGNAVSYYFSDHLKTTDIVTDAQGNIKNESDFYPWGGELQFLNNDSNHYKFTGKERDNETNLDYFGARYYSNALGRWLSPDWSAKPVPIPYADITDPQTLNLYGYLRALPTTLVDQDGHGDAMTGYYQCLHNPTCAAKPSMNETAGQAFKEGLAMGSWFGAPIMGGAVAEGVLFRNLIGLGYVSLPAASLIVTNALDALTPGPSGTLTISMSTRLAAQEISTGVRLAEQTGARLVQSEHVGAEFVDAAGKTYDAMGGGKAFNAKNFGDGTKFMESIVKHVNKSVDKVAIDLKGASKDQVGAIKDFVKTLTKKQQDKVIYVK